MTDYKLFGFIIGPKAVGVNFPITWVKSFFCYWNWGSIIKPPQVCNPLKG